MQTLIMATGNAHKASEVSSMLEGLYTIKTLKDIHCDVDIPETGETFKENALQKAQYIWQNYQENCFSDDSGLQVDALNGEPGVYSARYGGIPNSDEKNNALLLKNLEGKSNRKARFKCVIALILNGQTHFFEGTVEGSIRTELSGTDGFGYDPLFQPEGYEMTFSEMSSEEKNKISHRGRAIEKMKIFLDNLSND
ncbi:MAG: RdgB/HAM1 family non-canonical purine NTP pyrophosphatase [Saprospiraceae bacterium]